MNKTDAVTSLDVPTSELTEVHAAYFRICEDKLGFVPNVLKAYAFSPTKLAAFIAMADDLMLGDSNLPRLDRELIAVAVSAVNHCHYCLTAHGAMVRYRANDPELGDTVEHNYRAASVSPKQKAMLDFAVKITERPDEIVETDREALRTAGFSDRDIWDIAAVAAFFNMSNRLASAVDMRPNPEYFSMTRVKRDDGSEDRRSKSVTSK